MSGEKYSYEDLTESELEAVKRAILEMQMKIEEAKKEAEKTRES